MINSKSESFEMDALAYDMLRLKKTASNWINEGITASDQEAVRKCSTKAKEILGKLVAKTDELAVRLERSRHKSLLELGFCRHPAPVLGLLRYQQRRSPTHESTCDPPAL
jgi:hypothetical protein